jgi:hypothetical protein
MSLIQVGFLEKQAKLEQGLLQKRCSCLEGHSGPATALEHTGRLSRLPKSEVPRGVWTAFLVK